MSSDIDTFLNDKEEYPSPIPDGGPWEDVLAQADSGDYWDEVARQRTWLTPYQSVRRGTWPDVRWFEEGTTNITLDCLDRHIRDGQGHRVAYIALNEQGESTSITYTELLQQVEHIASGLADLGVKRGDRVIIYFPLIWQGIACMLACARMGAIHSVVYAGLGAMALRTRIEQSGAHVVLAADVSWRRGKAIPLLPIVQDAVASLQGVERVIVLRRLQETRVPQDNRFMDWNQWLSKPRPSLPVAEMKSEDPLFILFTSGTTGQPKGAVFVHGGFSVGVPQYLKQSIGFEADDVFWCMSDIGWIVGHSLIVYGPLILGLTTVIREGVPDFPQQDVVWDIIERYQVTKLYLAPTVVRMLRKMGEHLAYRHNLQALRLVACAGEPLNPEAWRWLFHTVGKETMAVVDNWWQTETAAPTIGTGPTMAVRVGRTGKPFPGVRVRIVKDDGTNQSPRNGGRLVLTEPLPQMFRDVWGDHSRYLEYFNEVPGHYLSGDVAAYDDDGYIEMLGRADDVINVAGHRIGTADVESALITHPAVVEAAAIGVPDPIKGQTIVVYVMVRDGIAKTDDLIQALVKHVRQELGPIGAPSAVRFPDKLPKTRSGKIMRRVVKAWELNQDPGDLTTLDE